MEEFARRLFGMDMKSGVSLSG